MKELPTPGRVSRRLLALTLAVAAASACSTKSATQTGATYGASTSEMAVRGFLDSANVDDYQRMSGLFGTDKGPAVERFGVTDIEQRMMFLAGIYFPAEFMPGFLQAIGRWLPLTHMADVMRYVTGVLDMSDARFWATSAVFLGMAIVLFPMLGRYVVRPLRQ